MIQLKAISPADGWAYVEAHGSTWLVRPPYRASRRLQVSDEDVQRGVVAHGFSAAEDVFENWEELIGFLNTKVAEARAVQNADATEDVEQELLDLAPVEVLAGFLGRVESELIPNAEYGHAEDLLLGLLRTRVVGQTDALRERAVRLLRTVTERKTARLRIFAWPRKQVEETFPFAFREHRFEEVIRYANDVSDRHHLLQLPD
jgi:hypothetical protein